MKKYPKLVQTDKRGQIVIPKEARTELGIDEHTGFYIYIIPGEGLLLKQIEPEPLEKTTIIQEIKQHQHKIGLSEQNITRAEKEYKVQKGGLEDL